MTLRNCARLCFRLEAYAMPFALYYLGSIEATAAEPFVWVPPIEQGRVLGIAAGGPRAVSVAASILFPHHGGRVVIAYPDRETYHRISTVAEERGMKVWGEPGLEDQLPFLARVDVLYILADWTEGPDLGSGTRNTNDRFCGWPPWPRVSGCR